MEVKHFKVQNLPVNCQPNSVYYVLDNITVLGEPKIKVFITDLYGIPIPTLDLSGTNGITNITSTDSSITITGSGTNKNIQVSSTLQTLINSALQSGDAISSLLNDAGYITLADVPTFNPSNYDLEDFTNNGADVFIRESDLGAVATSNDYNDLDNKPVIPLPLTNHSELNLDDGTNPHGTTQADVGLPNVNNTSDIDKPISTATQNALNGKQNTLGFTPENVANKNNTTLNNSSTEYPTSGLVLKEREAIVVSSSQTAVLNRVHNVVATATLTDPTPTEGMGYMVNVINGVATVGGTEYTVGTELFRVYNGTEWVTYNKTGYIPLTGTTEGNEVTGVIEFTDTSPDFNVLGFKRQGGGTTATIYFTDENNIFLRQEADTDNYSEIALGSETYFKVVSGGNFGQISVNAGTIVYGTNDPTATGFAAVDDLSNNIGDLDYTQKIYVDNQLGKLIQLTTTEILALTPETGRLYYNITINQVVFHDGSDWKKITSSNM